MDWLTPFMRTRNIFIVLALLVPATVLAQDPKKDYPIFDEGVAKFKADDYAGAINTFSELINRAHVEKLDEDLYYYRGQAYYHTGDYAKAIEDLNKSMSLNHFNKGVLHWYLAKCYDKQGKTDQALSDYKEAINIASRNKKLQAQMLNDRANLYSRTGNASAAQADLALAKSLDPANSNLAITSKPSGRTQPTQQQPQQNDARKPADEKKTTQLIVNNKPKEEPKREETPPVTQPASTKTGLVPGLAEAYKDEKRYALVIGNSVYPKEIGLLKNPANDATDMAAELRGSNFEVQLLINATYVQIREAVRKFHEKLTNGPVDQTVGLFYYAGHGVQYQDENYLVPVDAKVQYEDDIVRMCFPVQRMVLANMERSNSRMNIVILDACRNNPFPATSRSMGSGLGEMKKARGSFIAYATAPGSIASDGSGRNGLYTQELLKAIQRPGLTIEQVFKEVRSNVMRLSGDKQYTWDSSNIIGEFYFKF